MSIAKRKIVIDGQQEAVTFNDVIAWVETQQEDSLRIVSAAIRNRILYFRSQRTVVAAATFRAGDRAQFSSKYGDTKVGRITKINRTTASITLDDGMRWKVSLSLLQPV